MTLDTPATHLRYTFYPANAQYFIRVWSEMSVVVRGKPEIDDGRL